MSKISDIVAKELLREAQLWSRKLDAAITDLNEAEREKRLAWERYDRYVAGYTDDAATATKP